MIYSMTGHGKAERAFEGFHIDVEIRSVNNRYSDVSIRLPRIFSDREQDAKDLIRKEISRGKITATVSLNSAEETSIPVAIDDIAVRGYLALLKKLKEDLQISGNITLDHLLHFSDIFTTSIQDDKSEEIWGKILETIRTAVGHLRQAKRTEGKELAKDIKKRVELLEKNITRIQKLARANQKKEFKNLKKRVQTLVDSKKLDEARLAQEIALIADKMDVTEECVRFHSHNKFFSETLTSGNGGGRRLNFLLQEMNREANTIGSKAKDIVISHLAVRLKEEVEKIREQVQNIE
jgi:uncharacterized protein (TIGR00255 family)